jgi:hypothetical protein
MTDRVRDIRQKNWYWINNDLLDRYAQTIKADGVAVYNALARSDYQDGVARIDYDTIAARSGVCRRNVRKTLDTLVSVGLIEVRSRTDARGRAANEYVLLSLCSTGLGQGMHSPAGESVQGVHSPDDASEVRADSASGEGTCCPPVRAHAALHEQNKKTKQEDKTSSSPTPPSDLEEREPDGQDDDDDDLSPAALIVVGIWLELSGRPTATAKDREAAEQLAAYPVDVVRRGIAETLENARASGTRARSLRYCVEQVEEVARRLARSQVGAAPELEESLAAGEQSDRTGGDTSLRPRPAAITDDTGTPARTQRTAGALALAAEAEPAEYSDAERAPVFAAARSFLPSFATLNGRPPSRDELRAHLVEWCLEHGRDAGVVDAIYPAAATRAPKLAPLGKPAGSLPEGADPC